MFVCIFYTNYRVITKSLIKLMSFRSVGACVRGVGGGLHVYEGRGGGAEKNVTPLVAGYRMARNLIYRVSGFTL